MDRSITRYLIDWKNHHLRMPLLVRGARQVGKTFIIERFANEHFEQSVTINFELNPELIPCFASLEPLEIISSLGLLTNKLIEPGKTLLFLDEIQDCPNAIRSLRYFKEKLPALHVIGAGSLLEFTLNATDFRMPVGRVQSIYMKPLSFKEFLIACGYSDLCHFLEEITLQSTINDAIHQKLLKLVKEYMVIGGMPSSLQAYLTNRNFSDAQMMQTVLLNTFRQDFGKYAKQSDIKYLQRLFEKAPGLVAEHFKYINVDPEMRSRDLKHALHLLQNAGLVYLVYATNASGLPLISLINEKQFKLLFLDIGLVMKTTRLEAEILLQNDLLLVNKGKLAEQFVGQELLAYTSPFEEANIFYWMRDKQNSMAEIDFITSVDSQIIPIEVKAGAGGRLKSLKMFMEEKKMNLGVRISQLPLSLYDNILSIPLYLIGDLPRIIKTL